MPDEIKEVLTDEKRVLVECFSLDDNPFEPKIDAQRGLDFQKMGVSLAKPLDIFRVEPLKDYFAPVGAFDIAVQAVDAFFKRSNYPADGGPPPAFLIQGVQGVGRSTMAIFLAYQIKVRKLGNASLKTVPVTSEHWGRLLFTIKKLIKQHVENYDIPNCDEAFDLFSDTDINPQDPSVSYLAQIFTNLGQCMVATAPLILVIESITWERRDWMADLYGLLNQLNVVLIFLTDDRRIFNTFRNVPKPDGFEVGLNPFDRQMAEQFLTLRLKMFRRANSPQDKSGLFPFPSETLDLILPPGKTYSIKWLEQVFRGAFNAKLKELLPLFKASKGQPPNPQVQRESLLIPYKELSSSYVSTLRPIK
jgi:hypothetical protein